MNKSLILIICVLLGVCVHEHQSIKTNIVHDTITIRDTIIIHEVPSFVKQSPKDGLKQALSYYQIKHPEIVYAQAVLETGNFTSGGCTRDNNLFGIMSNKGHAKFNHWSESVVAYKDKIQYKHKPNENYYAFLKRIGYAEDPNYTIKLREILAKKS